MSIFSEENGIQFFENIVTSTRTLIESGLWQGINLRKFENWIAYFTTDQEKVLCGLILESLVFRSKEQTQALLSNIVEKSIPQLIQNTHPEISRNLYSILTNKYPREYKDVIKIVPVIKNNDPPTKSGPLVARLYNKEIGVNDKFMEWPWNLKNLGVETKIVIFIDDFVGTGDQFLEFFNLFFSDYNSYKSNDFELIYAPLGACKVGLDKIRKFIPGIKICQSEIISEENKFFSGLNLRYKNIDNDTINELINTYNNFLNKFGLGKLLKKYGNGYGGLELTYAYAHGTPNATLPILWASSEQYESIFSR